LYDYSRY